MRVANRRLPDNAFERLALATIAGFDRIDGIVTNNVILPHRRFRNLPNEHDLVVLLPGRVVTLDLKELWPGSYRDALGGWEHQRENGWRRVEGFGHPIDVAFRKARVMGAFLEERIPKGGPVPQVLSCIVVPDACDVSGLGVGPTGRTELGARLLVTRLADLAAVLTSDLAAEPQARPTPEQLAQVLQVDHLVRDDPYRCFLHEDLEVLELLERPARPVPREVYLGIQPSFRGRRVRIEVCPHRADDRAADRLMRSHRSNLTALQGAAHPAILRLFEHHLAPAASIFVSEFFSRASLETVVADGPLDWPTALQLFRDVVGAIDAAHAARVTHRYLEPRAILVAGQPLAQVRVRDFFGAATPDTSTFGQDPADDPYAAPERGPGSPPEPPMDWYSVGACLRFALTGDPVSGRPVGVPAALPRTLAALAGPRGGRALAWQALRSLLC